MVKKLGTPETKILIILTYYICVAIPPLIGSSIEIRNTSNLRVQLLNYFTCEQPGHNPDAPCDTNTFRQNLYHQLSTLGEVLRNLFPLICLLYVVNVQELKTACGKWQKRRKAEYGMQKTVDTIESVSKL